MKSDLKKVFWWTLAPSIAFAFLFIIGIGYIFYQQAPIFIIVPFALLYFALIGLLIGLNFSIYYFAEKKDLGKIQIIKNLSIPIIVLALLVAFFHLISFALMVSNSELIVGEDDYYVPVKVSLIIMQIVYIIITAIPVTLGFSLINFLNKWSAKNIDEIRAWHKEKQISHAPLNKTNNTTSGDKNSSLSNGENSSAKTGYVIMIIATVFSAFSLIPLAWMIPMTLAYKRRIYIAQYPATSLGVCSILFALFPFGLIAGILILTAK